MLIHAVDSLLEIHNKVGKLNDIQKVACKRRTDWVLGPNKWQDVKYKTKEVDAKVIFFTSLLVALVDNCLDFGILDLRLLNLTYMIGLLYFGANSSTLSKYPFNFINIYNDCVLDMNPNYTSMTIYFYGVRHGKNYNFLRACRDIITMSPSPQLISSIKRTVVRYVDFTKPS